MIPGQVQPGPDYYPYRLGQDMPGDLKSHAFVVSGRDEKRISTQGQILNLFLKHRVKITSHSGYIDESSQEFVLSLSCDLKNADIAPAALVVELRLLKFVKHARSVPLENRLFDGFYFPITLLDNRVIVLDSQFTFLIEHQLVTPEEKAVMVEVGRIYALDTIRQIRSKFPRNCPEELIQDSVNDYFKAAGLGRLSLLDINEKSVQAIVRDPPVSERGEATGNHFIQGLIIGFVETFQGREMRVAEDLFDSKTSRLFIVLLDKNSELKAPLQEDMKVKALEEVEKVINSIERVQSQIPVNAKFVETSVLVNTSSASLNQVLKTYQNEKWVGGKIADASELKEGSSSNLAKYQIDQSGFQPKQDSLVRLDSKQGINLIGKAGEQGPDQDNPRKTVRKPKKKETEEEIASAFKSALSENDDKYFEESNYL